jgi:hypothetical protein
MDRVSNLYARALKGASLGGAEAARMTRYLLDALLREPDPEERADLLDDLWPAFTCAYAQHPEAAAELAAPSVDEVLVRMLFSQSVKPGHLRELALRAEARADELYALTGGRDASSDPRWSERWAACGPRMRLELLAAYPQATSELLDWASTAHEELGLTHGAFGARLAACHGVLAHLVLLRAGDFPAALSTENSWEVLEHDAVLLFDVLRANLMRQLDDVLSYLTELLSEYDDHTDLARFGLEVSDLLTDLEAATALRDLCGAAAPHPSRPRPAPGLAELLADPSSLPAALAAGTLSDDQLSVLCESSGFDPDVVAAVVLHWSAAGKEDLLLALASASDFAPGVVARVTPALSDPRASVYELLETHDWFHDGDGYLEAPSGFLKGFSTELTELAAQDSSVLDLLLTQERLAGRPTSALVLAGPTDQLFDLGFENLEASMGALAGLLAPLDWEAFEALAPEFAGSLGDLVAVLKEA